MSKNQWWQTKENNEVSTKRELWKPIADRVGGFDLDPASGAEDIPIADTRYTKEDDGLKQEWFGTVWLNPPFGEKERWYKRLVKKYESGAVERGVALATADISTNWFHKWFSTADVICFLEGRDWYNGKGNSPTFSTQVGAWNPTPELIEWFESKGTVVYPSESNINHGLGDF